jgi:hypothetical protein
MAKIRKGQPRYNVISMRITQEERTHLDTTLKKSRTCVSHFMRDAMNYFTALQERGERNDSAA